MQEIAEKGDQYAKRMMDRKKEQDMQSPECYSRSIRRRLSIMEAIKGKKITPPKASARSAGNPFKKEFCNNGSTPPDESDDFSRCYVTTWPETSTILPKPEPRRRGEFDDDKESRRGSRIYHREHDRRHHHHHQQQQQLNNRSEEDAPPDYFYAPPVYRDDDKPCLRSMDANSNDIDYRRSKQYRLSQQQQLPERLPNEADEPPGEYAPIDSKRSSYFGGYVHRIDDNGMLAPTYSAPVFTSEQLQSQEYLGDMYEQDFEQGNAELERKGVDQFFGARVLEILEPQIVQVEPKISIEPLTGTNHHQRVSMQFVQESFEGAPQLQRDDLDSATTSFISESVKELDYEIDKMQFRPQSAANTVLSQGSQQTIAETPVRLYPNLQLADQVIDKVTPKKLFHKSIIQDTSESIYADNFHTNTTATFEDFQKSTTLDNEVFSTPLMDPITDPSNNQHPVNVHQQDDAQSVSSSFIKRSTSFLLNNLPNVLRRKPNLESTRKIFNSGGKITSPGISHRASTISTLTIPNTPYSPENYEQARAYEEYQQTIQANTQQNMENTIPYEVENFFKLAVGDEYSSTIVTYAPCDMQDQISSHLNASELISEDTSPVKNVIHMMRVPKTEQPNHSSTLNRTVSFYKTLTQRIKKKFRGSIKDRADTLTQPDVILPDTFPSLKDSVKKLLEEVDIQQTLIYQASKALELCSSMREFVSSCERVESERLLMLASLRKKAALDEIRRLTGQQSQPQPYCERADVTLTNLSLQLRDGALRCDRQNIDVVEWFVVVVTEGLTVWATQAFICPKFGSKLDIPGKITIPNVTPDFCLTVKVYNLKLQQQIHYNHEEKYHITTNVMHNRHTATCPSPKKLLKKVERKRTLISPKQFEIKFSGIKESSFNLCGTADLMLHDLNLLPPWPLSGVPPNSVLYGTIDLSLTCDLNLVVSHAGFLTVGDEAGGFAVWNRRWCILDGRHLHFWNYPREQECKPPLYSIDLVTCVSRHISLVDRSMCARPRTLLVETSRRRKAIDRNTIVVECRMTCTILRNLLSCDTNQDLVEWQTKLNHVVCALREWSILETKRTTEVSDL